jgi:hypothetical protein
MSEKTAEEEPCPSSVSTPADWKYVITGELKWKLRRTLAGRVLRVTPRESQYNPR